MRISDWSSDVCSSDVDRGHRRLRDQPAEIADRIDRGESGRGARAGQEARRQRPEHRLPGKNRGGGDRQRGELEHRRSEEHTSELQSLMRISYAVFCLKKKNITPEYTK